MRSHFQGTTIEVQPRALFLIGGVSAAVALLVVVLCGDVARGDLPFTSAGRSIEIVAESAVVELGQPIPVEVRFWNRGEKPWTLGRPDRSGWVSVKCIAPTHQQAGFDDWYIPWIRKQMKEGVTNRSLFLLDNPIMENYSFGFSLGETLGSSVTLPDGTTMHSWGVKRAPEIAIKPNENYEFQLDLYRNQRSARERKQAPHLADAIIRSDWRPGPWSVYVAYRAGRPDLPHRIQSRPVEFSLVLTERSVDHLLHVVKSPEEGIGPRYWATDYLWLLKPAPTFDWPWYDATDEEREKAKRHNDRVIAELEEFWNDFKGTEESRQFLRELNAAFGIDDEILDKYFAADANPGNDREEEARAGNAAAPSESEEEEQREGAPSRQESAIAGTGRATGDGDDSNSGIVWTIAVLAGLGLVLAGVKRIRQASAGG